MKESVCHNQWGLSRMHHHKKVRGVCFLTLTMMLLLLCFALRCIESESWHGNTINTVTVRNRLCRE